MTACNDSAPNVPVAAESVSQITLNQPVNAPVIGTSINAMLKPPDSELVKMKADYADYVEIAWADLELPGQSGKDILQRYKAQIDAIPEGDPSEQKLLEKMQAEMNAAPVNPAMQGKKVKLPGFIAPLEVDEQRGMVKEFLLVPNFGSCIHVPPPPLNNTILVKPLPDKSIGMERIHEPVWVYGTLNTAPTHTSLAEAGYQLQDAKVQIYDITKVNPVSASAN